MFNEYESNVQATIAFLKLQKVKVTDPTVNEALQNHPDWPSLLSISDALKSWNVPNAAGKAAPGDIDQLPNLFMAFTNNREHPFAIVKKGEINSFYIYQTNYNKPSLVDRESLLKIWDGIYLVAAPNEYSGEPNYEKMKRQQMLRNFMPLAAIITIILLSFVTLNNKIQSNTGSLELAKMTGIYIQSIILLAGIFITTLLLWYDVDKSNPLLQKVCTGISKSNCSAILSSKQARPFSWLSWSEVGFFYFTANELLLLFSGYNLTATVFLSGLLSLLVLPYTVFSIYYQWRVARQWCALCLAVQGLLVLSGITVWAGNFLSPIPNISASSIFIGILLLLLPVLSWYALKAFVLRLQESKTTKRDYLRFKFNAEIFETILRKQKQVTFPAEGLGITLGNPSASNTLIKVCNPYCGPCAQMHPKIDRLLESIPNLNAQIIFTAPNDSNHVAFKPVNHLMAIAAERDEHKTMEALDQWYAAKDKNYDNFKSKYPMNGELTKQGSKIEQMEKWCDKMHIEFTPTIFINGFQLPNAYSIEDLQYFLAD